MNYLNEKKDFLKKLLVGNIKLAYLQVNFPKFKVFKSKYGLSMKLI